MKFSWKTFIAGSVIVTSVWLLTSKNCPAAECIRDMKDSVVDACKKFKEKMDSKECSCNKESTEG